MAKTISLILVLGLAVQIAGGTIRRVSLAWNGVQANGRSFFPAISGDGRYVVFTSDATNLVPDDTNGQRDVFLRDLLLNSTTRVSVGQNGEQANAWSNFPEISANGRYVFFSSGASNMVANDFNAVWDVFVRDMASGTTTLVSLDPDGKQFTSDCFLNAITADGSQAIFTTILKLPQYTYDRTYAFVRDLAAGTTRLLSYVENGQTVFPNNYLRISADGRYLSHVQNGVHLVDLWSGSVRHPSDAIPPYPKCFEYGIVARIEQAVAGPPTYACYWNTALAGDGSLLFINYQQTYGGTLVNNRNYVWENPGGVLNPLGSLGNMSLAADNFTYDNRCVAVIQNNALCLLEWRTGQVGLVSRRLDGQATTDFYGSAVLATGAPLIAFDYVGSSLVANDTNNASDIFVYDFGEYLPPAIAVCGRISDGQGKGVGGVQVAFNPGGTTSTDADGNYCQILTPPWSGTITPSRSGAQFVPAQRSLANLYTDRSGEDFRALLVLPGITVERKQDRAWLRRISYNLVTLAVSNETSLGITDLRLFRREAGAADRELRRFLPAEMQDNRVTYIDTAISAAGSYEYYFLVDLANGETISSPVQADHK